MIYDIPKFYSTLFFINIFHEINIGNKTCGWSSDIAVIMGC